MRGSGCGIEASDIIGMGHGARVVAAIDADQTLLVGGGLGGGLRGVVGKMVSRRWGTSLEIQAGVIVGLVGSGMRRLGMLFWDSEVGERR